MTIETINPKTWCPGCFNFQILSGLKNAMSKQLETKKKEDFAIVTGIGCHAKIFDYINLNGINTLHGRVLPTTLGLKIANPNLNVLAFSGDGDAYSEGMEHLIHAARFNANVKYFIHNNQVFALTVGQPTPTTELYFKDKTTPLGVQLKPLNPLKIMLAANASFVARVYADSKQVEWIIEEALKHKGFAFIEIIQPCIIFHSDQGFKERTYMIENHDSSNMEATLKIVEEFDYNNKNKIPLGIFYKKERVTLEELHPLTKEMLIKKTTLKDIKR